MTEQHVGRGRLLDEHVERRARDLLGIERVDQRLLIDQDAARAMMMRTPFFISPAPPRR